MKKKKMNCPCEVCLVRSMCKENMCDGNSLVVELALKCSYVKKYLAKESEVDTIKPRIRKICYALKVKYFTWR